MAKRTRPSANSQSNDSAAVQRAAVRRAQASGKRHAKAQAERVAQSSKPNAPTRRRAASAATSSAASTLTASSPAPSAGLPISTAVRRRFVWSLILLVLALIGVAAVQSREYWWRPHQPSAAQSGATPASTPSLPATPANVSNRDATGVAPNETSSVGLTAGGQTSDIHIGIISGHRGNDSGAVCDDGLTEASVAFNVATRVAGLLRATGYTVDILDEFDPRLNGYTADALLSIHADSCKYINDQATGYKIARFLYSDIPDIEDKMVACISSRYKRATGLHFHRNTVTHDMLEYHALRVINPKTPGAIIEIGFLYLDRAVLTRRQDDVAHGIAAGLQCFLQGETP